MKASGQVFRDAMPPAISTTARRLSVGRNSATTSPTTPDAPESPGGRSSIRGLRSLPGSSSPFTLQPSASRWFTPVMIPELKRSYSTSGSEGPSFGTPEQYSEVRKSYFVEQQPCSPEEVRRLEEKFGPALERIAFQPPGLCHTQVSDIAYHLAKPDAGAGVPSNVQQGVGFIQGSISNRIARLKAFARGGELVNLKDICEKGMGKYATVVVSGLMGVADTKSGMVHATVQCMNAPDSGAVVAGANHCVAILDVDTETGRAYIFDPDYTRETPEAKAMRTYCLENDRKPHELSYHEVKDNGWLGELLRSVPAKELSEKCVPQLVGGVQGFAKDGETDQ